MYSTIGGRRGPAAAAWFLTPPRRTSWRTGGWRWRMRGCPVFIKAGCDRMVKLRAGNSGPYDNPALMRLVLLVSRGSSIYPHGPAAQVQPMQTIRNIVKLSRTYRALNIFSESIFISKCCNDHTSYLHVRARRPPRIRRFPPGLPILSSVSTHRLRRG